MVLAGCTSCCCWVLGVGAGSLFVAWCWLVVIVVVGVGWLLAACCLWLVLAGCSYCCWWCLWLVSLNCRCCCRCWLPARMGLSVLVTSPHGAAGACPRAHACAADAVGQPRPITNATQPPSQPSLVAAPVVNWYCCVVLQVCWPSLLLVLVLVGCSCCCW